MRSSNRYTKVIQKYEKIAKAVRRDIIRIIYNAKAPHIGSSFSAVEILVALYFKYLKVSPRRPFDNNRDKFILSKGHGCSALYAVLARKGFINSDILDRFGCNGGALEEHPSLDIAKGIECSTGSLGHGLSIGVGMALAAKYDRRKSRVYVLLSDGETESGCVWEAAMFAGQHKLDNLIAIVDYNKIQALGKVKEIIDLEPYGDKWRSFGWEVREIDGHHFGEIFSAFNGIPFKKGKPSIIIAHTVKGKGVSFMEDRLLWHYRCPDKEEYDKALKELA
jgi:transketolase